MQPFCTEKYFFEGFPNFSPTGALNISGKNNFYIRAKGGICCSNTRVG